MANKKICIIGGGTVSYIRPHFAICSPAYGTTARELHNLCRIKTDVRKAGFSNIANLDVELYLTRMAGGASCYETNDDIAILVKELVADPATKIIFMCAALCDFELGRSDDKTGKYGERLKTRDLTTLQLNLVPAKKIVRNIRAKRKDIFAVAFKATSGATQDEQYLAGLNLLKEASVNLVLANDIETRVNMIITPEEARYHTTTSRDVILSHLVDMALLRSSLTFTRSTVVAGNPVPWNSALVPQSLRAVVDFCIAKGAYKPFRGATVGHFACKVDDYTFLTSIRKSMIYPILDWLRLN